MTLAEQKRIGTIFLDVMSKNDDAAALYRRFGFAPVGVRRGYYVTEGQDAIVMRKDLT